MSDVQIIGVQQYVPQHKHREQGKQGSIFVPPPSQLALKKCPQPASGHILSRSCAFGQSGRPRKEGLQHYQEECRVFALQPMFKSFSNDFLLAFSQLKTLEADAASTLVGAMPDSFLSGRGKMTLGTASTVPAAKTTTRRAVVNKILSKIPGGAFP